MAELHNEPHRSAFIEMRLGSGIFKKLAGCFQQAASVEKHSFRSLSRSGVVKMKSQNMDTENVLANDITSYGRI